MVVMMDVSGFKEANRSMYRKPKPKAKPKPKKERRWVPEIRAVLKAALEAGEIRPGETVYAKAVHEQLRKNGIQGLPPKTPAIGNAMGARGLGLTPRGKGFVMPDSLKAASPIHVCELDAPLRRASDDVY